jgi:membrane-bound lytic murein transglycosylase D
MDRRSPQHAAVLPALLTALALFAGCAGRVHPQVEAPPPPNPETSGTPLAAGDPNLPAPARVDDAAAMLIALSNTHFTAGKRELDEGHMMAAREQFNLAVDVLLESPDGGRTDPRVRDHFDRLVDRISALELKALAEGDGFTEQPYEPATIDELLAISSTFGAPVPPPALQDMVELDLRSSPHDLDIPLNAKVLSYVELFQGRLHDFLAEGLSRGAQYLPMIQDTFKQEGLPIDLSFVPLVESGFKATALSRARAMGMWQFMAGTGAENGLRRDWYLDERSDPAKATIAAARYLSTLGDLFDGDWQLALASYNGGPGRVQRAMTRAKSDDFWKLSATTRYLPRETREYVPMILAAIIIARNPALYGFKVEPMAAPSFDVVPLTKPVDLRLVAEWTDASIDEIQALNPELRRWTTPIRDASYQLRVPAGTAAAVRVRLLETADQDLASLQWYTVRKGETLSTIARKLKVSRTDLAEANYLRTSSRLQIGQRLIVPNAATTLLAARTDRTAPGAGQVAAAEAPLGPRATTGSNRVKTTYRVRRGDTLTSIARQFETTVQSIRSWNKLPGDRIRAGDRLTVYKLAN